jgi:hypothetical protein
MCPPSGTLKLLFLGGSHPACLKAVDCDDSGGLELSDVVFHLNFLFLGGDRLDFSNATCGLDPTADGLSCDTFRACN